MIQRKSRILLLCLFCFPLFLSLGYSQSESGSAPSAVLIKGATLIDGTDNPPISDTDILLEGDRIRQIGQLDGVVLPSGAQIIEAQGKYVIPGLIDMHVHYDKPWLHRLYLANGVTTVRDLGSSVERMTTLRQEIAVGNILAPRLFISGMPINPRTVRAMGLESSAEMALKLAEAGVDGIKVTGYTPEELRDIVRVAHDHGLKVYGHTGPTRQPGAAGPGPRAAVEAGLDGIEHGTSLLEASLERDISLPADYNPQNWDHQFRYWYLPMNQWVSLDKLDELVGLMAENDVYFSPTMITFHRNFVVKGTAEWEADPARQYITEDKPPPFGAFNAEEREQWRRNVELMKQAVLKFQKEGGLLIVGTDSPGAVFPGWGVHQELELFVEAGLTPLEALQAATLNGARVLQKEQELGTVQVGKLADLLILDANPLENIAHTQRIHRVISKGVVLDPEALLKDNLNQFGPRGRRQFDRKSRN
jgi:imidazolonepropionase-like amidohydrolase